MNVTKTTGYIVHGIATAVLALTSQISLAGSATWLLSPQNSAWENVNNWTPGGPPNGPSAIATFAQSSQTGVNISTREDVNSIAFTSGSAAYRFSVLGPGQLTISGTGVSNNSSVLQAFGAGNGGKIIFNNTATAASADMSIVNSGQYSQTSQTSYGSTIFNDSSSAAGASITNRGTGGTLIGGHAGETIFNGTSTAGHAAITNSGGSNYIGHGGSTTFNDSSNAGTATLVADRGSVGHSATGGEIVFNDAASAGNAIIIANDLGHIFFTGASTGGTARVEVSDFGSLDIRGHQSGVTIGSIEGPGFVGLGANNLTVGTNDIDTAFSGRIDNDGQRGSLAKIGRGVLTLQPPQLPNDCIADTVGLILVSGSIVNLDFTGPPDVIASLKVDGVPQPPGIYGGPMSGAPNILPEFEGSGTVSVGPVSTLGNISTRGFVGTGDNVLIGGFIVQGPQDKTVIIRAIGPGLTRYGVPNPLANPTLELHNATGALIASNNDWATTIIRGIIRTNQVEDIRNSGYAPGDALESAIIADLGPGNYTAVVRGVNNSTGVALAEVYDLSPETYSILGDISTRSLVQTGDNVMIGGFIVAGIGPKRVLVRAIGPELTQFGVLNAMVNPTLELDDAHGTLIASNDNWRTTIIGGVITSDQASDIQNSGYAPGNTRESAIIADLPPGSYSAIVRGVNNSTGVGLVEVYDLLPRVPPSR